MLTSFCFLDICLINSCLLKDRNFFSENLRRPVSLPGHLCTQERINRLLSISKRTRLLFLETENYLLVSEVAMALFDSKIKINFKEETLYRVLIFVTTSDLRIQKKYLIWNTFLGVLLSRLSAQVEICSLFEQRFPPLEPCATPPSWLKIFSRCQIAIWVQRKGNL